MTKTIRYLLLILTFFNLRNAFAQTGSDEPFNASFWNSYADKLQLQGKDREEFMNAHKRRHSGFPLATQQSTQSPQINQRPGAGSSNSVFAGPCINADFESGNLTGWTRSCGFHPGFNPLGCCPNPNGQQTIMTGAGLDPAGGFPVVFPGGNFSLRLGNNVTGGEADRIQQTFLVSPANANFSYRYAVVFQDPGHPANQQPSFQVEMLDSTGTQVPCTFYYVAAGAGIPGFQNSAIAGVIYKPWTTVLVDLTPYIGQNLTIRFTTFDCSLGGHYGYAYIDGVCQAFTGGGSATVCAGTPTTFCAPNGVGSYTWNGPGVSNVTNQCVNVNTAGVYTVQTTLITGCTGPTFMYTLTTQNQPTATAVASNSTICANNSTVGLTGTITGYSSTPVWTSSGSGAFSSSVALAPTYSPSAADILAGNITFSLTTAGNGICGADVATVSVAFTPSPNVNAGLGGSTCSTGNFALNGAVTGGATTGTWSTNGNGSFSPNNNVLNPSYTPGSIDIATGSVTLTLTSSNNGNCLAVSDTVIVLIKQPSSSNAGLNQALCSSSATVALGGTVSGGSSTGAWISSGGGVFAPSNTNLNATYSLSAADITAGQVTFTLNSTNNGPCPVNADTVLMTIVQPATVNAGPNQFICATAGTVNLNGTVNGSAITGSWSTPSTGSFNPGNTSLSTSYSITPADVATGTIIFTLTSTNNAACPAVSDSVMIKLQQPAIVNAGTNQSLCSNNSPISLSGTIGGGSSTGFWSSSGTGGYTPGSTSLNTNYNMTAADIANASVIFTLTSTNNGPCPAEIDTVMMVITKLATVTAGGNQVVCANSNTIALNGAVSSSSNTGIWSTSGTGAFSPTNTVSNPVYSITPADIAAGNVTFTLTSTNNNACNAVGDSVQVVIKLMPTVNAGSSKYICSNTNTVALTGLVGGGTTTGIWSTGGSGGFIPSSASLNNTYFISSSDMAAGVISFTLGSTNSSPCPAVTDTMFVYISPLAQLNAGNNQFLCSTANTIALNGTSTAPVIWTASGSGAFTPTNTAVSTSYSFTANDASNGIVTFTLASTNNGACPVVTDTVMMRIKKPFVVNAGQNVSVCSTTPNITLNGNVSNSGTGMWTTTGTGIFSPNAFVLNPSYQASAADVINGTVNLILTSTNNQVCPAVSDTTMLTVMKNSTISPLGDTAICSYQNPIKLMANVSGGSGQYVWTSTGTGSITYSGGFNSIIYTMSAADITAGVIKLTISSVNSTPCSETSSALNVIINPTPTANFVASTYTATIPNDPISFTNQSSGANSYSWNFGDGNSSTVTNPIHNFLAVGFYNVQLVAINQYNCRDTASQEIKVISDFQFPNVFTPNPNGGSGGSYNPLDMSNDVFFPYTSGVVEYDLMIFNRWGELIFRSRDVTIGWDGYFNGKICQQDAYVWKANVKFFDGRTLNKTGTLTLLR